MSDFSEFSHSKALEISRVFSPLQGDFAEDTFEFDLVEYGSVTAYYGYGFHAVKHGGWLFARGDASLYLKPASSNERLSILRVRMSVDFFPQQLLDLPLCRDLKAMLAKAGQGLCCPKASNSTQLHHLIEKLHEAEGLDAVSQVYRLMDTLSRVNPIYIVSPLSQAETSADNSAGIINRLNDYMQAHITEPFSLAPLARIAGVNTASLSRLYKRKTGISPSAYIEQIRVAKACQLLDTTDLTFKQISYQCGYVEPPFFLRLFRRLTGLTPMQYRNRKSRSSQL